MTSWKLIKINFQWTLPPRNNGTELYVKVDKNNIGEQFPITGADKWGEITLWFGGTQLTEKHKLWPWGTGNKYSLVQGIGGGKYFLDGGGEVSGGGIENNLKEGKFEFVVLDNKRWKGNNRWSAWESFWGNQCRYQGNGKAWGEGWDIQVRCTSNTEYWSRLGPRTADAYVTVTLTKKDYELFY